LDKISDGYRALVLSLFMCVGGGMALGFGGGWILASRASKQPLS